MSQDSTLRQAIRNLDQSALQIALVVASGDILVGTLTDGDVRRGLLRGLDLDSEIEPVIHRDPLCVPPGLAHDAVMQVMQVNRIHQLPVVDAEGHVVGLHLWDVVMAPGRRQNLIVLMAGGRGTRLRPLTDDCPKPMLPVSGKPMLAHVIEKARAEGFDRFVLAVHYLGNLIEDHFGDGSRWNVSIDYLREKLPLGTAGALSLLAPRPEAPLVVSNGDVLSDVRYGDLLDFHVRNEAVATMAVRPYMWRNPYGVVRTKGIEITGFEEKPTIRSYINAGVYVLEPAALDVLELGAPCEMPALFGRLQEAGKRTIVYPMYEQWQDVGSYDEYASAQDKMRE